jgi:hypothetical protein
MKQKCVWAFAGDSGHSFGGEASVALHKELGLSPISSDGSLSGLERGNPALKDLTITFYKGTKQAYLDAYKADPSFQGFNDAARIQDFGSRLGGSITSSGASTTDKDLGGITLEEVKQTYPTCTEGNTSCKCRGVLTTITEQDFSATDTDTNGVSSRTRFLKGDVACQNLPFEAYLNSLLREGWPYVMLAGLISLVYYGWQYMTTSYGQKADASKARVVGILIGIVFFSVVRIILDLIGPNISL